MVESAGCSWCRRFRNEVAPSYDQSGYGARAPLRYLQVGEVRTSGYQFAGDIRATPTFVLVDRRGKEIDRVRGYPGGGQRFYTALDGMLAKAPVEASAVR